MSLSQSEIPAIARDNLTTLQGSIWRHRSGAAPEYLCMATRVSENYVVTVADRGVDGFARDNRDDVPAVVDDIGLAELADIVEDPILTQRFADLRLHSHQPGHPDDEVTWVYWAAFCPLIPLVFLSTSERPLDGMPMPLAPTAEQHSLLADKNPKLWRVGYGRGIFQNTGFGLNRDFSHGLQFDEGYLIHDVSMTWFRGGADKLGDKHTLAAHSVFNYPGPVDWGAPIVTEAGALAGVLIGSDFGIGTSCHGAYIPIDLIMPFLWREHAIRAKQRHHMAHHHVIHYALPGDEC